MKSPFRCNAIIALALTLLSTQAWGEDVVQVRRPGGGPHRERRGEILDLTGRGLVLRTETGQEETVPLQDLVSFVTPKGPEHESADQDFAEGRADDALARYRAALENESRSWMRREILARIVWCYRRLESWDRAGETFLLLLRADGTTPHFEAIPLTWNPVQPDPELEARARGWLQGESAAANLMGASWLLATAHRSAALQALDRLAHDPDPRIAFLAEAQRWRSEIVTADVDQVDAWRSQVHRMPRSLRAGPWYLIGNACARLGDHPRAAAAFMHVPIEHPLDHDLAARALAAAHQSLVELGWTSEAERVALELVERFPAHPAARTVPAPTPPSAGEDD